MLSNKSIVIRVRPGGVRRVENSCGFGKSCEDVIRSLAENAGEMIDEGETLDDYHSGEDEIRDQIQE